MAVVEIRGLVKQYGDFLAVNRISLSAESGEFLSLLGPSGCGKTTTLRMVAGLIDPDQGDVFIGGQRVNDHPVNKRNIGMVFQSYALFPHMTVAQNVGFGLKMRSLSKKDIADRVERALVLVQLEDTADRYPRQLSGGQQQRVALARAIVIEPAVLLLDEPLSNLDAKLREHMRIELKQLQEKLGVTTIYVTHDQSEALTMSDRVAIINHGVVEQLGTPLEVYESPATEFVTDFLGRSNFLSGQVVSIRGDQAEVVTDKGQKLLVGDVGSLATAGDLVHVSVRPERIRIIRRSEELAMENRAVGKIEFISYLGASSLFQVLLDTGERLVAERQNLSGLSTMGKDEEVCLEWQPDDCLLTVVQQDRKPQVSA